MKSTIVSLCLLFVVACNNTVSLGETESEDSCAAKCRLIDCPDSEDPESDACPAPGSSGDCAAVYPECDSGLPPAEPPSQGGAEDDEPHPMTRGIIVYTAHDGDTTTQSDTTSGDWQ